MIHRRMQVLLLFLGLTVGQASAIQSIVRTDANLLRVDAENVPLGVLLEQFAAVARVESMIVDPDVKSLRVSVTSKKDLRDGEAINEILEASGVNYAVYGGRGRPFRIFAGNAKGGRVAEPAPPGELDLSGSEPETLEHPPLPTRPPEREPSSSAATARRGEQEAPGRATGLAFVAPSLSKPPNGTEPVEGSADETDREPSRASPAARPPRGPPVLRNRRPPSRASGPSFVATDAATLSRTPRLSPVSQVVAFLSIGLCFGVALVADPKTARRARNR